MKKKLQSDGDYVPDSEPHNFAPRVVNPSGKSAVVLVCEHASAEMPEPFDGLGLRAADRQSHIAWDPGAGEVARLLSKRLDAVYVHSTASRLIYDCNRPPEAPGAIPERSESTDIPGNAGLSQAARQERVDLYYRPFEALLAGVLDARAPDVVLVTIHSFTPVYFGKPRSTEIGILHDEDSRLADALLQVARGYVIARNDPYGPEDGVTHTLRHHGLARGLPNVMIEIRNDLIATPAACAQMAEQLAEWLQKSLAAIAVTP